MFVKKTLLINVVLGFRNYDYELHNQEIVIQ